MTGGATQGVGLSAADFSRAHDALMRRGDLQFALTAYEQPKPPDWLKPLFELLARLAPIFPYVFWGGLIVGVLSILYFVLREFAGLRLPRLRRRPKSTIEPEWRPTQARARTLLEEADQLAAEGRFGEAAHLILFRGIEDIDGRWPNLVRPALTSRDIAAHRRLPDRARQAFGEIARVVERNVFGGAELAADDFAFCRRAYEAFALPGAPA
ncbi:MAG TPA: hypothetical protein VE309_11395 [Caulobacteraceae bacterium]|nr:hypothetical protein [Caulobacteraceae bacterium]